MRVLFVSDVHVGPAHPRATSQFLQFLGDVASQADALYLLGDIFDAWLGDDDMREPHASVVAGLRTLSDSGVSIYAIHGNHDFLLGTTFASATGATLLPEISEITLGSERVTLCHGDELCTDDAEYQIFRRFTREPQNQKKFLSQTLAERAQEAQRLAQQSRQATQLKPENITDANADAIRNLMTERGSDILIHGHTHQPAEHVVETADGKRLQRRVLGAWYETESILVWDGSTLHRVDRAGAADCLGK